MVDHAEYRQLAGAVLQLALNDAMSSSVPPAERDAAIAFLTTRDAGLVFWAGVAGLNPDAIVERTTQLLASSQGNTESVPQPHPPPRQARHRVHRSSPDDLPRAALKAIVSKLRELYRVDRLGHRRVELFIDSCLARHRTKRSHPPNVRATPYGLEAYTNLRGRFRGKHFRFEPGIETFEALYAAKKAEILAWIEARRQEAAGPIT